MTTRGRSILERARRLGQDGEPYFLTFEGDPEVRKFQHFGLLPQGSMASDREAMSDGRIDEVAAQRPEPRQNTILVRSRQPAVADDIRDQNRRDFPGLAHGATPQDARGMSIIGLGMAALPCGRSRRSSVTPQDKSRRRVVSQGGGL
jgi:hypothetical protein